MLPQHVAATCRLVCTDLMICVWLLNRVNRKIKVMGILVRIRYSLFSLTPAFASALARLLGVHFLRYPPKGELAETLSDLSLALIFSGPLQEDLFKEK